MLQKLTGSILYSLLVAWGVVTVVFFLFNVLPGDPARMMLGQRSDLATLELIREEMGFNESKGKQYLRYLNDLSPLSIHSKNEDSFFYFDHQKYSSATTLISIKRRIVIVLKVPYLGKSFQSNRNVNDMIRSALPNSLILAFTSILFAFIIGNILVIFAAIKKGSWFDNLSIFFSTTGMALPSFFAAIIIGH